MRHSAQRHSTASQFAPAFSPHQRALFVFVAFTWPRLNTNYLCMQQRRSVISCRIESSSQCFQRDRVKQRALTPTARAEQRPPSCKLQELTHKVWALFDVENMLKLLLDSPMLVTSVAMVNKIEKKVKCDVIKGLHRVWPTEDIERFSM